MSDHNKIGIEIPRSWKWDQMISMRFVINDFRKDVISTAQFAISRKKNYLKYLWNSYYLEKWISQNWMYHQLCSKYHTIVWSLLECSERISTVNVWKMFGYILLNLYIVILLQKTEVENEMKEMKLINCQMC